ncbi:hypothetical protein [Methanoregula sp.]|jgi:hypothetical protein|uniref:hypothetical protein n=1 Tax=Methanoregula sp. TaxID=2052170 RepID=UPI003C1B5F08
MSIGVRYPDHYAVEETFQLLKVPWEWYFDGREYDVVIARKEEVPCWTGPLIDLTTNDYFSRIADILNTGQPNLHEPVCDILIDTLRQELKKYMILVEIPPVPWGHPYMVALTHDVDVTSVKECRLITAGYAAFRCVRAGAVYGGIRVGFAWLGIGTDPWVLFNHWKTYEKKLGVRSTFFFVPRRDDPGVQAHPYRAVRYDFKEKTAILHDLEKHGWETGVHGIDNWTDPVRGKEELEAFGSGMKNPGNRTHWLLFDKDSWKNLDKAGYRYDTTFGYNDDAGFRAGTTQVYQPRGVLHLLELPLHIQDLGLLGKFCWAPSNKGWVKTPCLQLDEIEAHEYCSRIFDFARTYGGAITILWHYENLIPPRDLSGFYADLVKLAQADGAWVTTAGAIVTWYRQRRGITVTCEHNKDRITVVIEGDLPDSSLQPLTLRIHNPDRQITVNTESNPKEGYTDIRLNARITTVFFS